MRIPINITIGHTRKKKQYPTEDELAQPATLSAYTNLNAKFNFATLSGGSKQRLQADSVVNIKGVVLENNSTWRNDREQQWSRESTRLVVDDTSALHRYTLGDINTESRNYQQGIHIAGLRIEKMTGIDPYKEDNSASKHLFSVEQDSEVKIYVNGFLKDKKQLDAGEYNLTDLHLESGVNKVRLQITDKTGKSTEKTFTLLQDRSLLKSGEAGYAVQIGIPAQHSTKGYQYDRSAILVSGHYKTGLTDQLTADTSFITDGKNIQVGVNAIIPTAIGNLSGRVSQLRTSTNKQGYAAGFEYQSVPSKNNKEVTLSLSADIFDKEFSSLSYSREKQQLYTQNNQDTQSRISANFSKKLTKTLNANINIQRETSYKNTDTQYSANIGISKSLQKGGTLSAQLRYQNKKQKDKSLNIRFNLPLTKENKKDRYKMLSSSYDSLDDRLINSFFIAPKGSTGKDSVGLSVSSYSGKESHTLNANISYRGEIAEMGFSQSITQNKQGTKKIQAHSNAQIKTAISFADGQFAVSKPIRDSFVIITGPENQDKDIAVNKGGAGFTRSEGKELPDRYHSLIQKDISPAVINISSYYYNNLNIDSTALPLGSDLESTEFNLKSGYKQGYLLKAGGEAGVIVDATLLDTANKPLSLKGGELIAINSNKKPISFFTNRTGRIRLLSVPPGKYQLELFDNKNKTEQILNIPNKIGNIYNIGKIHIRMQN
jgi:outer membrane usher protein